MLVGRTIRQNMPTPVLRIQNQRAWRVSTGAGPQTNPEITDMNNVLRLGRTPLAPWLLVILTLTGCGEAVPPELTRICDNLHSSTNGVAVKNWAVEQINSNFNSTTGRPLS